MVIYKIGLKIENHLKNKEKAILGGSVAIAIIVIVSVTLNFQEEEQPKFDVESANMLKSYKGEDGEGQSVIDILSSRILESYPEPELIAQSPAYVEWYAYKDDSQGEETFKVGLILQTFKEDSEYVWHVNKKTGEVTAGNDAGQELLDQVNNN